MTRNTSIGPNGNNDWNENNLKTLTTNNWRASLVPAAAVTPAPRVYIKVVAVKKLVVGLEGFIYLDLCFKAKSSFYIFSFLFIFF